MQARRDAGRAVPGWPLRADESLVVTDARIETLLAWSEDIGDGALHLSDVFDENALHTLRGPAGLSTASERGVIAGDISTALGPRRVLLQRRADIILLHLRPPTPPDQQLADPMLALSILLRSLHDAPTESKAATACANLRALLGATEAGVMYVTPEGANTLHAARVLDPAALPQGTCADLLEMRETGSVVHLFGDDRTCRALHGPISRHLPPPVLHDPALPEPSLLIFGPVTEQGAICFFCGKFARAPLSFEMVATLDIFAQLFAMVAGSRPGEEKK